MPQTFHRCTNTISRVSIFGAVFVAATVLRLLAALNRSSYTTEAFTARKQPVKFSHRHHVSDDGIDCRYCHTSVETSSFAGLSPTRTCMNCHSQIFANTRSMLEHTLDRVDPLGSSDHRVTVTTRSHLPEAEAQLVKPRAGAVVVQPVNRNTAPGVFLGLAHVRAKDPKAIVMIFPSDHFIHPEDRFVWLVRGAVQAAVELENLVLVGVRPERPETEYGWIVPGRCLERIDGQEVRTVDGFLEKPEAGACRSVMARGGLWNTLILAARAEVLWHMGERYLPEMMGLFEAYGEVTGLPRNELCWKRVMT